MLLFTACRHSTSPSEPPPTVPGVGGDSNAARLDCACTCTSPPPPPSKRTPIAPSQDAGLQKALARSGPSFIARRTAAVAALPEFEQLRDIARDIKNHTLAHLDFYLEDGKPTYQHRRQGALVRHRRRGARCGAGDLPPANARTVTKGKSMISEELGINDHLERHGITPVETDLGEYIIQLRHELPSHIIAPAFHLNKEDWEETFRKSHTDLPPIACSANAATS